MFSFHTYPSVSFGYYTAYTALVPARQRTNTCGVRKVKIYIDFSSPYKSLLNPWTIRNLNGIRTNSSNSNFTSVPVGQGIYRKISPQPRFFAVKKPHRCSG